MPALCPETLLQHLPPARRYLVAFSGGCDSLVLLHLMRALRSRLPGALSAAHVNHGLHPLASDWAAHCGAVCRDWDIPFTCHELALEAGANLEARAREARYRVLADGLDPETVLLTAHHADDQAETVLLRMLRGSGVVGLAGIRGQRSLAGTRLARPLLGWSRAELRRYARARGLQWLEDPANDQLAQDRNFLRHEVLPTLSQRWPAVAQGLSQLADDASETDLLLADLARLDGLVDSWCLPLERIRSLSGGRARNLVRQWIRHQGLPVPGRRQLEVGLQALCSAGADRAPEVVWPGGRIRRYRHLLYLDHGGPPPVIPDRLAVSGAPDQETSCGRLSWHGGGAFDRALLERGELYLWFGALRTRLVPLGRPAKRLGRLLQEAGVPPWQRPAWPMLCTGDAVLAVPGVCVCEGAAAVVHGTGLSPCWEPNPDL